jgi:hypothetical protein
MVRRRPALIALAALLTAGHIGASAGAPAARPLRVCVLDTPVPPYFNLDAGHTGWSERLMLETGRSLGLRIEIRTEPVRRCLKMLEQGETDAIIAAPVAENLALMRFPMKADGVDRERRLVSVNLVWVKRRDSPTDWDGQAMTGLPPNAPRLKVIVRAGLGVGVNAVTDLGYEIEESGANIHSALRMLNAGRFDLLLGVQELVNVSLRDPALHQLVVMSRPLMRLDFYVAASRRLDPASMAHFERWWQLMGELRDHPSFNRD